MWPSSSTCLCLQDIMQNSYILTVSPLVNSPGIIVVNDFCVPCCKSVSSWHCFCLMPRDLVGLPRAM